MIRAITPFATTLLFALPASAQTYEFVPLGSLGGDTGFARAINDSGVVVGSAQIQNSALRPFLWDAQNGMRRVPDMEDDLAYVTDITEAGNLCGYIQLPGGGGTTFQAFQWSAGTATAFPMLAGDTSAVASGLNDAGKVVGSSGMAGGTSGPVQADAVVAMGTQFSVAVLDARAHAVNATGVVTGQRDIFAFVLDGATPTDLPIPPTFERCAGLAINDAGDVGGYARRSISAGSLFFLGGPAVIWESGGAVTQIQPLAGHDVSTVYGMNEAGQAVGTSYRLFGGDRRAWIYENGEALDLNTLVQLPPGARLMAAYDINESGAIVGDYLDGAGVIRPFLIEPIECPGTNFCTATANSTGSTGTLGCTGSTSLLANDFALVAEGLPASANGVFFLGTEQVQVPLGNGFRCVGGTLGRLGTVISDAGGTAALALDFNDPALAAISAGATFQFQFWHRDVPAGGAFFNLTDGLEVTFSN